MSNELLLNRRDFLAVSAAWTVTSTLTGAEPEPAAPEPIIDIHQHTNYSGRTDEQLIAHQRTMGVSKTVLLPAGTPVERPSTHMGKSNGLAAQCGANQSCVEVARQLPKEFLF